MHNAWHIIYVKASPVLHKVVDKVYVKTTPVSHKVVDNEYDLHGENFSSGSGLGTFVYHESSI